MKKASASFLLVITSALFVSTQSFAQFQYQEPRQGGQHNPQYPTGPSFPSSSSEMISERVQQTLRFGQRMGLSELLRLSPQEQRQIEVLSLSISGQGFQSRGLLDIVSQGRLVGQIQLRRQLSEQRITLPALTRAEGLELSSQEDLFIESITAEIIRPRGGSGGWGQREQQPLPQQMLTLRVDQDIRGMGEIALKQMVEQQLGLTLEGAEIERVVVTARPTMRGRIASVGIELNGRLVGPMKAINPSSMRTPLPINSFEEIRTLRLVVNGEVRITDINIRIGNVRPIMGGGGHGQRLERVHIGQEISANRPLELSRILPHEFRSVRSIALEARATRSQSAEVALLSWSGQLLASVIVSQIPLKSVLHLMTPMSIRDIRLQSLTSVIIDSLEIEFDRSP